MTDGRFFALVGIDGSGKGTLLTNLVTALYERSKRYDEIVVTREPTYGRFGRHARDLLNRDDDPYANKEDAAHFFVFDRVEHIASIIEPAVRRGATVLSDRFFDCTIAYQGAQGHDIHRLVDLHRPMLAPDAVLLCDCSVETALARRSADSGIEKFEVAEFQRKVQEIYYQCFDLFPDIPHFKIDTAKSKEDAVEQSMNVLEPFLPY